MTVLETWLSRRHLPKMSSIHFAHLEDDTMSLRHDMSWRHIAKKCLLYMKSVFQAFFTATVLKTMNVISWSHIQIHKNCLKIKKKCLQSYQSQMSWRPFLRCLWDRKRCLGDIFLNVFNITPLNCVSWRHLNFDKIRVFFNQNNVKFYIHF